VATEGGITVEKATEKIQWRISVPLYKNTVIWRQIGLAVGIPCGLVTLVMALSSGKSVYALYGLGFIAALLLFIWIFIMAVYQGTYEAEFVLDDKGALCRTPAKQAQKSLVVNALTAALEFLWRLSGRPAVTGAGLLARSQQTGSLRWDRVTEVKYKPKSRAILLRGGRRENVALFCTAENYAAIEQAVQSRTNNIQGNHGGSPV
jgi:hypothetical protein